MLIGTFWNDQERPLYIAVSLYILRYILCFGGAASALKSLGRDTIPVRARSAAPPRRCKAWFAAARKVFRPARFPRLLSRRHQGEVPSRSRSLRCYASSLFRNAQTAHRAVCKNVFLNLFPKILCKANLFLGALIKKIAC